MRPDFLIRAADAALNQRHPADQLLGHTHRAAVVVDAKRRTAVVSRTITTDSA